MKFKMRHSLTLRLTLLFATASTVVLLALGYLIGNSIEQHFEELDVEQLSGKLVHARHVLSKVHSRDDLALLPQKLSDSLDDHHGLAVAILDPNGVPLFKTDGLNIPQSLLAIQRDGKTRNVAQWQQGGQTYRGISASMPIEVPGLMSALVIVVMDISHHQHFMDGFSFTLWSFVTVAAILMGLLGWVSARRGLSPLSEMKQDVAEISASRLDQRLSAERFPNELADLGATLNGMLSRLDNSFSRLSNFSSDIAHELRTPLSNLMTQTQVALSKARSADEYHDLLASNAEELERMARMIADMLFLAQSDNGLMLLQTGSVFLAQEFRELSEFYDALLEEKSITLNIVGEADIQGDRLMLRRAFSNLLSNAIRHTPAGGEISVMITRPDEKGACVEVCNPGDIPKEHLPHLFERFYRVDPSRHRDGESTGLGLAITKSILDAHHCVIKASSEQGKVRFKILF